MRRTRRRGRNEQEHIVNTYRVGLWICMESIYYSESKSKVYVEGKDETGSGFFPSDPRTEKHETKKQKNYEEKKKTTRRKWMRKHSRWKEKRRMRKKISKKKDLRKIFRHRKVFP